MPCKLFLLILPLFLFVPAVSAHASLVRAEPAPNAVLPNAPNQITLSFDEAIDTSFSSVQVIDSARARFDTTVLVLAPKDAREVRAPLKPLGNGTFTVIWKVLSAADGHITRGVYAFSIGETSAAANTTAEAAPLETAPIAVITRGLNLYALLALVGAIFFREVLLTRSLRVAQADETLGDASWRVDVVIAVGLLIGTELARLLLQANLVADAVNAQTISQVLFDSRLGAIWLARFILIGLLAFLLFRLSPRTSILFSVVGFLLLTFLYYGGLGNDPSLASLGKIASAFADAWNKGGALHHLAILGSPFLIFFVVAAFQDDKARRFVVAALLLMTLFTFSLTGHSAAQGDFSLGVFVDWLHLLAVSFWVGGLFAFAATVTPIWRALGAEKRGAWLGALVANFSRVALVSVVVLVLTGLYSSLAQIPTIAALVETLYGQTLLVKIALFVLMLNLGAIHLLVLGGRFITTRGETDATRLFRMFRALIVGEGAIGLIAIAFAGYLTVTPPARSALTSPPTSLLQGEGRRGAVVFFGKPARDVNISLAIAPTLATAQEFSVRVTDEQGKPRADIARVIFEFTDLDDDTGATRVNVEEAKEGRFVAQGNYFPLAGMWRVQVTVRRAGVEDVAVAFPVFVGGKSNSPNDAGALDLLRQSDGAMNRLKSVRAAQELNDGANAALIARYEYLAPDRMHYVIEGQGEVIVVLGTQFVLENGKWSSQIRAEPFRFPDFNNAALASNAKLGRGERIGDAPTQIVRFASPRGDTQYALWIGDDKRVRQMAMVANAHFMLQQYLEFDAAVKIEPPIVSSVPLLPSPENQGTKGTPRLPGPLTGDLQGDAAIALFILALVLVLRAADKNRAPKSRGLWLVVSLALIGAAIFLYADAINASQYEYANAPIDEQAAARGKSVYEENCLACHGARGRGDGEQAASLRQPPADLALHAFHHDEAYLAALIKSGFGQMPAFRSKLSDAEVGNVVQYVRTLARAAR